MVRAFGLHPKGRGFNSFLAHQLFALTKYSTDIKLSLCIRGRGVDWLTHQLVTLKTASSTLVDPAILIALEKTSSPKGEVFSLM